MATRTQEQAIIEQAELAETGCYISYSAIKRQLNELQLEPNQYHNLHMKIIDIMQI